MAVVYWNQMLSFLHTHTMTIWMCKCLFKETPTKCEPKQSDIMVLNCSHINHLSALLECYFDPNSLISDHQEHKSRLGMLMERVLLDRKTSCSSIVPFLLIFMKIKLNFHLDFMFPPIQKYLASKYFLLQEDTDQPSLLYLLYIPFNKKQK